MKPNKLSKQQYSTLNRPKSEDKATIPVVKEHLVIDSLTTVTGEVEVRKEVDTQVVTVPLNSRKIIYREERHPINRVIDRIPEPRYEGENLIIPVVKEEEVVIKQLTLVEEVHLIKEEATTQTDEEVTLHSERVIINRK